MSAVNESEVRRRIDSHPEIAFMLIDNRFPDVQRVDRDGIGLVLAEEYRIPTILMTGGPLFSYSNPLVACLFSMQWSALEAATRWALALVARKPAAPTDEAVVADARSAMRRASRALSCEVARELPPPTGLRPYEPLDDRHVRNLRRP